MTRHRLSDVVICRDTFGLVAWCLKGRHPPTCRSAGHKGRASSSACRRAGVGVASTVGVVTVTCRLDRLAVNLKEAGDARAAASHGQTRRHPFEGRHRTRSARRGQVWLLIVSEPDQEIEDRSLSASHDAPTTAVYGPRPARQARQQGKRATPLPPGQPGRGTPADSQASGITRRGNRIHPFAAFSALSNRIAALGYFPTSDRCTLDRAAALAQTCSDRSHAAAARASDHRAPTFAKQYDPQQKARIC